MSTKRKIEVKMRLRTLTLSLLLGVAVLAFFPVFAGTFYVQLVTKIMILSIFALSLDLLVGYTGLVSLGHAAYFGVAAYTLALAAPASDPANFWLTLPLSLAASALTALVIGAFVVRTSGVYFIMVTLAFAQMHFYYVVLALLAGVFVLLALILRSPFGRALQGIKANEQRMRALGFATRRYKLAAFVLAGTLAGLAGYLAAAKEGYVNPELLAWHQSGVVLMMLILGGMGTLFGAVIGTFSYVLLQEWFSTLTKHWPLLMGGFIIVAVLFFPEGLAGVPQTLATRWRTKSRQRDSEDDGRA